MKRLWTGIVPLALAAALVSGCAGGSQGARALPPAGTAKKPDGMARFVVRYPTNLVRPHASAQRAPRFVDPYGSPILEVSSVDSYYSYASSDFCFAATPGADGTQTITVPVFSDGGAVRIREYQSGSVAADNISCGSLGGSIVAQTWNPSPGYSLSNTQIPYSAFTPGTDVYAFTPPTPTPVPTATSSASPGPTASPIQQIFSGPLTLQPVVSDVIYTDDGGSTYQSLSATRGVLASAFSPCTPGTATYTFLAADANDVSVGGNALATPAPNPSGSPTPTPNPTPAAYSGFLPVTFSQPTSSGVLSASIASVPGTMHITWSSSSTGVTAFTVTANDVFGDVVTENASLSLNCLG